MIAYVDSSILLRIVLREPRHLKEFSTVTHGVASTLLQVECLRVLDKLRFKRKLTDKDISERREILSKFFEILEWIPLSEVVLKRASEPFPTTVATLDSLHLSSALLWKEFKKTPLSFLTHDEELGIAARALGFKVYS